MGAPEFRDPAIAALEAIVDEVKASVAEVHTAVDDIQSSVTEIQNSDLSALSSNVDDIKTDVAGVKTDVASVKTDVAGVKSDTSTLKSDTTTLKSDTGTLKTTANTIKSNTDTLKSDTTTLKSDTGTLKTTTATIKSRQVNVKEATYYKKAATVSIPSGDTVTLLNVTGKGYLRQALAYYPNNGGYLKITVDGVAESYYFVAGKGNNAVGLVATKVRDTYGNQPIAGFTDVPNPSSATVNYATMLDDDLYFDSSLKIESTNTSITSNCVYQYWVGVTPS